MEPYIAEIRIFSFNFAPRQWAMCDGQLLPIDQNRRLYGLIQTTYGGDGSTTFALPDMRGRTPIHVGGGHSEGQKGGEDTHALSAAQMPRHNHAVGGVKDPANELDPKGALPAATTGFYISPKAAGGDVAAMPGTVLFAGGGQRHQNMQPFLVVNYCIALQGLLPERE